VWLVDKAVGCGRYFLAATYNLQQHINAPVDYKVVTSDTFTVMSEANGDAGGAPPTSSRSSSSEFKLKNAPSDGISRVRFGPSGAQFLLVSSWDNGLRLYDVVNNTLRVRFAHSAPILDCCFQVFCAIEVQLPCNYIGQFV
jgi:WD40 repeat protein